MRPTTQRRQQRLATTLESRVLLFLFVYTAERIVCRSNLEGVSSSYSCHCLYGVYGEIMNVDIMIMDGCVCVCVFCRSPRSSPRVTFAYAVYMSSLFHILLLWLHHLDIHLFYQKIEFVCQEWLHYL